MNARTKKLAYFASPSRFLARHRDKVIIEEFAQTHGLVYFGGVSQAEDEHRIVRGMTVSREHHDKHYCVGTYDGYDVSFVDRTDQVLVASTKKKKAHNWHIFEFDLLEAHDLPHIFVGMHTHSESFYMQLFTKYPELRHIAMGATHAYPAEFLHKYRVYCRPGNQVSVESIISSLVTEMVSKHFGSLAIEIVDTSLYVYAENHRLTTQLLEAMIKNGRWLADHIDTQFIAKN